LKHWIKVIEILADAIMLLLALANENGASVYSMKQTFQGHCALQLNDT
jgi:hypothetical protein